MTTVVFGGRGNVGSQVAAQLREAGQDVRTTSRIPGGADVVADLRQPGSLGPALHGAEAAFLYAYPDGIDGFVAAARQAGLRRVVFLSSAALSRPDSSDNAVARRHRVIEEALAASGLEWTFIRGGMFATNNLAWRRSIAEEGRMRFPWPQAQTAPVHEADTAALAVAALVEDGHHGKAYTLWGPESITLREQVEAIGAALGREIAVETVTADEARAELSASMPEFAVDAVLHVWSLGVDRPADVSTLIPELLGRPARTFRQWAVDHAPEFSTVP